MKKRLLEDIAASSNSSLIKIIMAGEEDDMEMRGKIHGCDDLDFKPMLLWLWLNDVKELLKTFLIALNAVLNKFS